MSEIPLRFCAFTRNCVLGSFSFHANHMRHLIRCLYADLHALWHSALHRHTRTALPTPAGPPKRRCREAKRDASIRAAPRPILSLTPCAPLILTRLPPQRPLVLSHSLRRTMSRLEAVSRHDSSRWISQRLKLAPQTSRRWVGAHQGCSSTLLACNSGSWPCFNITPACHGCSPANASSASSASSSSTPASVEWSCASAAAGQPYETN